MTERTITIKNMPDDVWNDFFTVCQQVSKSENTLLPILQAETIIIDFDTVGDYGEKAQDMFGDMMAGAVTLAALTVTDKYLNP